MASTKVRGVTIELGADTTGLSNALKGVNTEIGKTQKDLKDVERLLKLDPSNTELLAQKQKLLTDRVGETTKKLDALKQAQKNIDLSTEEGQRQYDALSREIISCSEELKKAQKEADGFHVGLQKVGAISGGIATKLSGVAQKTRGLSLAAGGAIAGIGGLVYKAAQTADELNTLAAQTGFTTEELQKMQYASERIDVSMETITGASAKMTKQLGSNEEKFEELGVKTKNLDGTMRPVTDIFYDTIAALGAIPNETDRDIAAMEIFGKSANELAGIIDDGGAKLRALGEEAQNMGAVIPQESIDKANEFNDAIDKVKAESMGAFAQIGSEIAEMVLPYIPALLQGIENVLSFIRQIDPDTMKLIGTIALAVAAISPVMTALSGVAQGIQMVSTAISFIMANPIAALIAIIIALVALIATKGDEIQAELKKVDNFLQNVFAKDFSKVFGPVLGEYLNAFVRNIKNMWDAIKKVFDGIIDFIRGVFTGDWDRAWKGVVKTFEGIFDGLKAAAKAPLNGIIGLLNMAISGINKLIEGFNGMGFDLPGWLGGGSWHPSIPTIGKIPYLARGGVVSSGSAVVGEAGPELLTMIGGRAVVQPLTNNNVNNYAGSTNNFYIQNPDPYAVAEQVSSIINHNVTAGKAAWA